jgi:methylthioribulose-1-phosphate dehydratase
MTLLEQLCSDCRVFSQRGWLMATSGNVSARHTSQGETAVSFWMSRSGLDKASLTPADFLPCLASGETAPAERRSPSAETLLHALVYQRFPKAAVVYHVHHLGASVLSEALPPTWTRLPLPRIEMLKALGVSTHETDLELPVFPNTQDMPYLQEKIASEIDTFEVPAFLLRGHGLYAWGGTPAEARRHLEGLLFLLDYLLLQRQLFPVSL